MTVLLQLRNDPARERSYEMSKAMSFTLLAVTDLFPQLSLIDAIKLAYQRGLLSIYEYSEFVILFHIPK